MPEKTRSRRIGERLEVVEPGPLDLWMREAWNFRASTDARLKSLTKNEPGILNGLALLIVIPAKAGI